MMRMQHLKLVFLAVMVTAGLLGEAPPAFAARCQGSTGGGFERAVYEVAEDAGHVQLQVCPAWGPAWQGQIDYRTSDLTAAAGHDYEQSSGTMTFLGEGGGCYYCLIQVPIVGDALFEGEERFEVRLTDYRGTFVNRGRESAVVKILDDENPISAGSEPTGRSTQQNQPGSQVLQSTTPSSAATRSDSTAGGQPHGVGSSSPIGGVPETENSNFDRPEVSQLRERATETNRSSSSWLYGLGILLLLVAVAGSFWARKRLGRG